MNRRENINDFSNSDTTEAYWTEIVKPRTKLLDLRLIELWRYRDLIAMFVQRDFVSNYKQTILGPIWFFLQPLLTTLTFVIVFGKMAQISTDGLPMLLFYLSGITIWNYFAETLTRTASVFTDNAQIFGKVYFPRLTMPFSIVVSNLIRFSIQFTLFLMVWSFYLMTKNAVKPNFLILLTPFLLFLMGMLALGLGMIISAMTTKYKDLIFLLTFSVQLLMYATPVIYPLSSIPDQYRLLVLANPLAPIIETFRYAYTGSGTFTWIYLGYSFLMGLFLLFCGAIIFNKAEKNFTDTI